MSKAELAGNYVASGGSADDADYVAEKLAEMRREPTPDDAVVEHAETREHVETADPDGVTLEVRGESIPCEPIGVGERLRPAKKAQQADERGDDMLAADAILDMIAVLVRVSPDECDEAFFDTLSDSELRDAFQSLGQQSAGGNGRRR